MSEWGEQGLKVEKGEGGEVWKGGRNHRHSSECVDSYCL